jgi:hypothetical protein
MDEEMPSEMVMYNLNGQVIASQRIESKTNTINVNALESGLYFIEVKNETSKAVKRLVVK